MKDTVARRLAKSPDFYLQVDDDGEYGVLALDFLGREQFFTSAAKAKEFVVTAKEEKRELEEFLDHVTISVWEQVRAEDPSDPYEATANLIDYVDDSDDYRHADIDTQREIAEMLYYRIKEQYQNHGNSEGSTFY